jgi:hypothetical protein
MWAAHGRWRGGIWQLTGPGRYRWTNGRWRRGRAPWGAHVGGGGHQRVYDGKMHCMTLGGGGHQRVYDGKMHCNSGCTTLLVRFLLRGTCKEAGGGKEKP